MARGRILPTGVGCVLFRRSALGLGGLLVAACTCGGREAAAEPEAPEPAPAVADVAETPFEPRLPPGFDWPVPRGATVRYSRVEGHVARVVLTLDGDLENAVGAVRTAFGETPLEPVSRRAGQLELAVRPDPQAPPTGTVSFAAALPDLTRVEMETRLPDTATFTAPAEPLAWRRVDRPPLPPPPGALHPACTGALRAACEAWAAAGEGDALDCAVVHRAACGFTTDAAYLERAEADARARIDAAWRVRAQVASAGARAEATAQLAVECLAAEAVRARSQAAGRDVSGLRALLDRAPSSPLVAPAETDMWFAALSSGG